jgi:hypothetical protein
MASPHLQWERTSQQPYAQVQIETYARQAQELGRAMAEAVQSFAPQNPREQLNRVSDRRSASMTAVAGHGLPDDHEAAMPPTTQPIARTKP